MPDYPLIADHGLIGNLQTAALVATDGTIDWFCAPRFDSPSIFGCLLDHDHGGHLRTTPTADTFRRQQLYYPDTAILVTRFLTEAGVGEILDFMPIVSTTVASDRHKLVRLIRCVRGEMTFAIDIAPRFDYGRESYETHVSENGVVFQGPRDAMVLNLVREPDDERLAHIQVASQDELRAELTLSAGQMRGIVLETGEPRPPREIRVAEAWRLFDETVRFWRSWLAQCTYTGRWRETLERSAITLKLMTYAPSGGIVAAPTAGLPEQIGGERNWDYRYTWIRDASFSVYALLGLGFTDEAAALGRWMRDRVHEQAGGAGGPLNIMYRVDGSSDLTEEILPHWEGYRGSTPGADRQRRGGPVAARHLRRGDGQHLLRRPATGFEAGHRGMAAICRPAGLAGRQLGPARGGHLGDPWRTAGFHLRPADELGRIGSRAFGWPTVTGVLHHWTAGAPNGTRFTTRSWTWDGARTRQAFVQHSKTDVLDASLLRMSSVGFISPTDPMWLVDTGRDGPRACHRQLGVPL